MKNTRVCFTELSWTPRRSGYRFQHSIFHLQMQWLVQHRSWSMDKAPLLFTKAFHLLSIGTSFGTDLSLLRAVSTLSKLLQPKEIYWSFSNCTSIHNSSVSGLCNKGGSRSVLFLLNNSKSAWIMKQTSTTSMGLQSILDGFLLHK